MKMYSILLTFTLMITSSALAMDEKQKLQNQQSQNTTEKSLSDTISDSSCCAALTVALEYCCCGWIFCLNKCTNHSNNSTNE
jgi:hypothetical protein